VTSHVRISPPPPPSTTVELEAREVILTKGDHGSGFPIVCLILGSRSTPLDDKKIYLTDDKLRSTH